MNAANPHVSVFPSLLQRRYLGELISWALENVKIKFMILGNKGFNICRIIFKCSRDYLVML